MKISKQKLRKIVKSIIKEAIDNEGNFDVNIPEKEKERLKYKKKSFSKGTMVNDPDVMKTDDDPYQRNPDSDGDGIPHVNGKEILYVFDFDDCLVDSEGLMVVSVLAGAWDGTSRFSSSALKANQPLIKKGGIKNTSFPMRSREFTNLKSNYPELFVWHNFRTNEYPVNGVPYDNNTQQMSKTAQTLTSFTNNDYKLAINNIKQKNPGYDEYNNYPIVRLSAKPGSLQRSYVSSQFRSKTPKVHTDYFLGKPNRYTDSSGGTIQKDNRPIAGTLNAFENAVNDPKGIPTVVTARSPRAATAIPFIIDEFKKGLLHRYDVYGTGISPQQSKGHVVDRLIVKNNNLGHNITTVVVYEDSFKNIVEIEKYLKARHPNVSLEAYHVLGFKKGSNFQQAQDDPFGDVEYKINKVR